MRDSAQKLFGLFASSSHFGAPLAVLKRVADRVPPLRPGVRILEGALRRYTDWRTQAFDRQHGTDTFNRIEVKDLKLEGERDSRWGSWMYGPVNPQFFREMMRAVAPPFSQLTFVDIGAGKGLALMLASEFGFRALWGIEFAPDLVAAGKANLIAYARSVGRPVEVEWTCKDVLTVDLGDGPRMLFLNNPFPDEIALDVLDHLDAWLVRKPRDAWVLYRKPSVAVARRLDASPHLRRTHLTPFWRCYRSLP